MFKRSLKIALFALSVWMAIPVAAQAATYFVDDEGADVASCGTGGACGATACRTWKYLVRSSGATIGSGDVINLCPTEGADVIYGSLDATECGIDLYGVTNLTFQGSTGTAGDVRVTGGSNTTSCRAYTTGDGSDPDATFRIGGASNGAVVKDLTIIASTPVDGSAPHGILIRSSSGVTATNVIVESAEAGGITCGTSGPGGGGEALSLTISDSTITSPCTGVGGCGGVLGYRCPLLTISNTTITNGGAPTTGDRDGVHLANSHGFTIDGVTTTGFSEDGIDLSRTGSGDSLCESWNAGGCVGGSEEGTACAADGDCAGGGTCQRWVIKNSTSYGNHQSSTGSALAVKSCNYHGLIYNNFLKDTGDGWRLNTCAHDIQFYNNSVFGALQIWQNHYDLDIRNNLLIRGGDVIQLNTTSANLEAGDETTFDYNVIYSRTGGIVTGVIGGSESLPLETQQCGGPGDVGAGTICCDIQAGSGVPSDYTNAQGALFESDNEMGNIGSNNIFNTDVSWVDETGSPPDLHLATGDTSGAKQGGVTIAVVTVDIDGTARPQGAAYEIGADEFVATGTTTTTTTTLAPTTTTTTTTTLVNNPGVHFSGISIN